MIKINDKPLSDKTLEILNNLQKSIDNEVAFKDKVDKAQSLWGSKGSAAGKNAFVEVKDVLTSMCTYVEVCNYCEQSEANDIEHIHPKSFFPHATFAWNNYLLACKQCNSGLKLDKCYVLDNLGNLFKTERGQEPKFKEVAFINPRTENPNDFMYINMETYKFEAFPWLEGKAKNQALITIEILQLNERATLIKARKSAVRHYYNQLQNLTRILKTTSKQELEAILNPADDKFDFTKSLKELKLEIKDSYKNYIQTYQHPSVWHGIKMIEKGKTLWKEIFTQIPEALNW